MQLESFSTSGFRSMAEVADIPLRSPTILTGRNDSGKSATLDALAFLLNERTMMKTDFRPAATPSEGDGEPSIIVTGQFSLTDDDRQATGLPAIVKLRRVVIREPGQATYEVERQVPQDERLRNLELLTLAQLKETAAALEVTPDGPANVKESFLKVLRQLAASGPDCLDWVPADVELAGRLPKYVRLSGADGADTRVQLLTALKFTYRRILASERFVGRVEWLQGATEASLTAEIKDLCALIEQRCDGLTNVSIKPQVSFRDALSGIQVMAHRDGQQLDFDQVGTGRRRQLVQAIWEWSNQQLTAATEQGVSVVIAYDEPDTSLDYARQRSFMDLVRAQGRSPQVRIIVATHSVQMIDQVPLEDVVHLELREGSTVLYRLPEDGTDDDCAKFLSQLAEELGLTTSSVLFERCFLLVEGESEKAAFPRLFRLVMGQRMQEAGIVPFETGGNSTVLKLVDHLRQMGKPVYVLVDKDSKQNQPKIFNEEVLEKHDIPSDHIDYIGDPNELEELFSDEQWAVAANRFWAREDGTEWQPAQIRTLRASGKFSDRLTELLKRGSGEDLRKPRLVARLAETLNHRHEVPQDLIKAFERVMESVGHSVSRP
jgi:putative ATP-dependent endonuclease of the OLD family